MPLMAKSPTLSGGCGQDAPTAAAGRHVPLIEDTSEINYQSKAKRKRGLGRVGNGGLLEAMLKFIARAKGAGFGLRAAVYEFQLPALLDAAGGGADVAVLFPSRPAIATLQQLGLDDVIRSEAVGVG